MKKLVALLVLLCLSFSFALPVFCSSFEFEPYSKDEFPKWALDLRRAESLFFGGLPIAFPVSALALGLFKQEASFTKTLAVACSITAVIALVDYIIGVINEN